MLCVNLTESWDAQIFGQTLWLGICEGVFDKTEAKESSKQTE